MTDGSGQGNGTVAALPVADETKKHHRGQVTDDHQHTPQAHAHRSCARDLPPTTDYRLPTTDYPRPRRRVNT